jgi:hypothetical protein
VGVSLRTSPVIEHAALPQGGTVTVWVGVPDDPYIDDKSQLTTVDIQLHEGNAVIASLSTVLDPDQVGEGHQLAREVKSALESGEIGLHADDLEPFADRLR